MKSRGFEWDGGFVKAVWWMDSGGEGRAVLANDREYPCQLEKRVWMSRYRDMGTESKVVRQEVSLGSGNAPSNSCNLTSECPGTGSYFFLHEQPVHLLGRWVFFPSFPFNLLTLWS